MNIERKIKLKNMENNSEPLSPDNVNEESILKSVQKNNDSEESFNNSNSTNTNDLLSNVNIKLNDLNENNRQQNISKITKKTQYKIYLPIVTIKIVSPSYFMLKYIIYSYKNVEDQEYCKYSVCVLTAFILFCYYFAVFSDCGQTNVNKYFNLNSYYPHRTEDPGSEIQNLKKYVWGDCPFCNIKKYMRTSHCRICNKCVLMRDHHCPFIINCVGFKNFQYFFNFVFWGNVGIFFYIISFINFKFFSGVKFDIPIYIQILMYIDVGLSAMFILNITGIMIRLLLVVYNNRTQKENSFGAPVENYCPLCYCCTNYPSYGFKREVNEYNIGFLSQFYYLIGPTILHFIFPLPKYNNYILNENCPALRKIHYPDRLDLFKTMVKIDPDKINLFEDDESSPDFYLANCHKFYENKKIV